ncbi:phosphoribosylglycinamide formyltransferase [Betaproteobacteria bacterium PRO7]|jgi:phosphoribosylglycinamide formyltransferase-1|nr:phosphoribosylglycinamide formyltransferase [Betaproteobacteria bacterium PRO7]
MKNIVCLISGRGSNLEAILRTARDERWDSAADARVAAVVSNRAAAPGLAIAREFGVPVQVIEHGRFASREAFDAALVDAIDAHAPALVVLAGFMRVLTAHFVEHYEGRLINIHPSLLPMFPGLATHRKALAVGVRVHGATVHFVSNDVDAGAIIAQAVVPVLPVDTEEALAARVLAQEHRLLPRCVRWVVEGRVRLARGRAVVDGVDPAELVLFAR